MQYMLLIMGDEKLMNAATVVDDTGMSAEYAAYNEALMKAGAIRVGERLKPTSATTSVRVRDKKAVVLDGPYTETQEQLGGFYHRRARPRRGDRLGQEVPRRPVRHH